MSQGGLKSTFGLSPNVEDGKWQISREGGTSPLWGPESRELFYRRGEAMMRVRLQTEPTFSHRRPEVLFTGNYRGTGILIP